MSFSQSVFSIFPGAVAPKLDSPAPGSTAYGGSMEQDSPAMSLNTILPLHKHQGRVTQKALPSATLEQCRFTGDCFRVPEVTEGTPHSSGGCPWGFPGNNGSRLMVIDAGTLYKNP